MDKDINRKVLFVNGVVIDNELWGGDIEVNRLYKISLVDGRIDYIAEFPKDSIFAHRASLNVILKNKQLFFPPFCSEYVNIYDLRERKFFCYEVPESLRRNNEIFFYTVSEYMNRVYMWGNYPRVMSIDVDKHEVSDERELNNLLAVWDMNNSFTLSTVSYDEYVYLPISRSNKILRFDMKERKFKTYELDEDIEIYALGNRNKELYIATNKGISYWNPAKNELIFGKNSKKICENIEQMYCVGNKFWLCDRRKPLIYIYCEKECSVQTIELNKGGKEKYKLSLPYAAMIAKWNESMIFQSYYDRNFYLLNQDGEIEKVFEPVVSLEKENRMFEMKDNDYLVKNILREEPTLMHNLSSFLKCVVNS